MHAQDSSNIEIRVDFEKGVGDPTRIFKTMAGLIEAAQSLDSHLAVSVGAEVKTALVLQDVEVSSLKAILRTVFSSLPEDAIRDGEVKKVVGHYLLLAKHRVLDWCGDRDQIDSREDIKQLQHELHELAEATNIQAIPAYALVDIPTLLADISQIRDALSHLAANDDASLRSDAGQSQFNRRLEVSPEIVRELVTRETIPTQGERIVKVKKPDYLGNSMWEFRHGGRTIEAKMADAAWLARFQSGAEPLNPGDSLRVEMREEVSYGYDSDVVHVEYTVLSVIDRLPALRGIQGTLP